MQRTEFVVVGAGFAGLAASAALAEAGRQVVTFEARDRVGGRVEARMNALGERLDLGGQFFCEDMPEVTALARRFDKIFAQPVNDGETVLRPPLPSELRPEALWREGSALRERLRRFDPDDPAIGDLNVADWTASQGENAEAKKVFLSLVAGLWCVDPALLPLWYLVSNDRRVTNRVSELQYFIPETMASLAEDLSGPLSQSLRLGEAVERIEHGPDGVTVHSAGSAVAARAALVAVPPVMARRITFSPALPTPVTEALEAWTSGAAVKLILRYPRPFWREQGLSGTVAWREPGGFYACEASPDEARPALVLFAGGPAALGWHRAGEIKTRSDAVEKLGEALGPEARRPLDVALRDWTGDRWSGGAYADVITDARARDAERILREGSGSVRFASSELSPSFPGYVEGALVAGREAARRLLAR